MTEIFPLSKFFYHSTASTCRSQFVHVPHLRYWASSIPERTRRVPEFKHEPSHSSFRAVCRDFLGWLLDGSFRRFDTIFQCDRRVACSTSRCNKMFFSAVGRKAVVDTVTLCNCVYIAVWQKLSIKLRLLIAFLWRQLLRYRCRPICDSLKIIITSYRHLLTKLG